MGPVSPERSPQVRNRMRARFLGLGALAAAFGGGTANAEIVYDRPAASNRAAYEALCVRSPGVCTRGFPDESASPEMFAFLKEINPLVNGWIEPVGGSDRTWNVIQEADRVRKGNCNDYAATKQAELIQRGFPPGALRLAVVTSRATGVHTVNFVSVDGFDEPLVLDNLTVDILPLSQTPYIVLSREGISGLMHARYE